MSETDPLAAAERLESSMNTLADEMQALREANRRNRTQIRVLIGIVVGMLVLGVAVGIVAVQAREATSQARRNAENAKVTCEAANEGRRLSTQLWTYVLDLSSQRPNQTAQQKQQIAQFRAYIAAVYAPRDCNATPTIPPSTVTPTR